MSDPVTNPKGKIWTGPDPIQEMNAWKKNIIAKTLGADYEPRKDKKGEVIEAVDVHPDGKVYFYHPHTFEFIAYHDPKAAKGGESPPAKGGGKLRKKKSRKKTNKKKRKSKTRKSRTRKSKRRRRTKRR
jgi:hypothetical protein